MRPYGAPNAPRLRPWHLPQWMYWADEDTLYYPDLEDLRAEILPFQQRLLGVEDTSEVERLVRQQLPAVLAHEMFHCWRGASGRLTCDHWHEEWAANRLAVAYAQEHCPNELATVLGIASHVLERCSEALDDTALQILQTCQEDRSRERQGYGMSLESMAIVTLKMLRRLALEKPELVRTLRELLTAISLASDAAA
jgi:hypothetical protein